MAKFGEKIRKILLEHEDPLIRESAEQVRDKKKTVNFDNVVRHINRQLKQIENTKDLELMRKGVLLERAKKNIKAMQRG